MLKKTWLIRQRNWIKSPAGKTKTAKQTTRKWKIFIRLGLTLHQLRHVLLHVQDQLQPWPIYGRPKWRIISKFIKGGKRFSKSMGWEKEIRNLGLSSWIQRRSLTRRLVPEAKTQNSLLSHTTIHSHSLHTHPMSNWEIMKCFQLETENQLFLFAFRTFRPAEISNGSLVSSHEWMNHSLDQ